MTDMDKKIEEAFLENSALEPGTVIMDLPVVFHTQYWNFKAGYLAAVEEMLCTRCENKMNICECAKDEAF